MMLMPPQPLPCAPLFSFGSQLVYNVYPPRPWAAALLLAMHSVLMGATLLNKAAVGGKQAAAAARVAEDEGQGDGPAAAARRRRRSLAAA